MSRRLTAAARAVYARVSPTYLLSPWAGMDRLRTAVLRLKNRADLQDAWNHRMESRMATFEESLADLDAATDEIADRLEAAEQVNAELRAAVAAGDADRAAALATQSAAHADAMAPLIAKLRGAGKDPEAPIETAPLPPVVDPGDGTDTGAGTDAPVDGAPAAGDASSDGSGSDPAVGDPTAGAGDGSVPDAGSAGDASSSNDGTV